MAKKIFGKTMAILLALILVINLAGIGVFAAQTAAPALVQNFQDTYYKQSGAVGAANDWEIHLSKTATPTGQDNVYDITLQIETKDIATQLAGSTHGAVALVLDVSSSMVEDAGACVNCGKAQSHNDHRGNRKVCNYKGTTHLALLKGAVKSFLDSYAATANQGDKRLVAIVKFATNADTVLSWIDVSNENNLAAVKAAVDAMGSTSGTNIEAGLALGRNLLNMADVSQIPLSNQSLILFSDGDPTVAVGNAHNTSTSHIASDGRGIFGGSRASDDLSGILAGVGAKKKAVAYNTDAGLLHSVFGAGNVITSNVGSLVPDLTAEAGKIVTVKTNASTVTDPMGTGVTMISASAGYHGQQWDLSRYTPTVANGITTYTITYQVQIDPQAVAADPGNPGYTVLTPANGATTLNYTYGDSAAPVSVNFNEPNIRGIRSFTVRYAYAGQVPADAPNVPAVQTYKAGQEVKVAGNPALEGYTFSGWDTSDFVMPARDVVITGSWNEIPKYDYKVSYNANFGANEIVQDAENVSGVYQTAYTIGVDENRFVREHYEFIGWNTQADGKGQAYAAGAEIALTAENNTLTLYAQWAEHSKYDYYVIYNANFGEDETKADSENVFGTYAQSHKIEADANSFVRENYEFVGWNTKANGRGEAVEIGQLLTLTPEANGITLYAQWQEHPKYDYKVIYNANYGLIPATRKDAQNVTNTYAETHTIHVDSNMFDRANHTFIGWAEAPTGEVVFAEGDAISFVKGGKKTLYAQWIEHDKYAYTLIYNGNGGALTDSSISYGDSENVASTYEKTHAISVDENSFVRANHTFLGWNTQADGKGQAYTAEDIVALTAKENTLTLYAQWQEHPKYDYSLIYNANFGENETKADAENAAQIYATAYEIAVDENSFIRENYEFIGWNTQADGKGKTYAAEDIVALTAEENSLTLYAQWQLKEYAYTVTYMVRVDEGAYAPFAGQLPQTAPVGGVAQFGAVLNGQTLEGIPAQLAEGERAYAFTQLDGITVGSGKNEVVVYYTYKTPAQPPVEPVVPPVTPPTVDIPDEPVPLAPAPSGLVDIPDEQVPLASAPKTGDPMLLYAGMSLLSGLGLLSLTRKKKEENEEI